jgi:hypothetical protein
MGLEDKILEIAAYTLPAIITGGVSFILTQKFFNNEENKRKYELIRENKKQSLPLRLQAYERIVLYLERINPVNLMMRVEPGTLDAPSYASLLIHSIQTEFEHNLTQQIYMSHDCWEIIMKTKNSIVAQLRTISVGGEVQTGEELRNKILLDASQSESLTAVAISYIKEEIKRVI